VIIQFQLEGCKDNNSSEVMLIKMVSLPPYAQVYARYKLRLQETWLYFY